MNKKWIMALAALALAVGSAQAVEPEFGLELSYSSRYVGEGIDYAPDADGIFFSELTLGIENVTLGGVFIQGINDSYNEVNIYLEGGLEWDSASAYSGVQFLAYPAGDEGDDSWEFYIGFEADLMNLATVYGEYFYDFDDVKGGFLLLGLESDIPQPVGALTVTPYVEFGVDHGYVSGTRRFSENKLQIGLNAAFALTEFAEVIGGVHHSFALTNLDREDEGDVTWAHVGIALAF